MSAPAAAQENIYSLIKFTYSSLGTAFEEQTKTTEEKGKKNKLSL